ncbi:hypothetical protein D3C87_1966820 [compost metagenome]
MVNSISKGVNQSSKEGRVRLGKDHDRVFLNLQGSDHLLFFFSDLGNDILIRLKEAVDGFHHKFKKKFLRDGAATWKVAHTASDFIQLANGNFNLALSRKN